MRGRVTTSSDSVRAKRTMFSAKVAVRSARSYRLPSTCRGGSSRRTRESNATSGYKLETSIIAWSLALRHWSFFRDRFVQVQEHARGDGVGREFGGRYFPGEFFRHFGFAGREFGWVDPAFADVSF